MKVSGNATLNAPVARVWAALNDPAVLVRTIPGCLRLEEIGPDSYEMTVSAGIASIKGTYLGRVTLTGQDPPGGFVLSASGSGGPGTVDARVRVRLVPDGQETATGVDYDADAVVGGTIGGVGQRVLAGVARRTASEFFAAVDDLLRATPTGPPTEPPAGSLTGPITGPLTEPSAGSPGMPAPPPGASALAAPSSPGSAAEAAPASAGPEAGPEAGQEAGPEAGPGIAGPVGGPAGRPRVFTAPPLPRPAGAEARLLGAVGAGGAVALAGVLLGWLLGRSGGRDSGGRDGGGRGSGR